MMMNLKTCKMTDLMKLQKPALIKNKVVKLVLMAVKKIKVQMGIKLMSKMINLKKKEPNLMRMKTRTKSQQTSSKILFRVCSLCHCFFIA